MNANMLVYGVGGVLTVCFGIVILLDANGRISIIPRKPGRAEDVQKKMDSIGRVLGIIIAVFGTLLLIIALILSL